MQVDVPEVQGGYDVFDITKLDGWLDNLIRCHEFEMIVVTPRDGRASWAVYD